jgi:hypothetical protein
LLGIQTSSSIQMKKAIRYIIFSLAGLILAGFVLTKVVSQPLPQGVAGPEADSLARSFMQAVNVEAWDSLAVVSWNFGGRTDHLWDKKRSLARVRWGKTEVLLDIGKKDGIVRIKGKITGGEKARKQIDKAWHKWANDSFWLNPIPKLFDPGTERKLVILKDGSKALLITYSSGGVTPGDSYLWVPGPDGKPAYWKMWVQILPIKGLKSSWEGWQELPGGAWVASLHKLGPVKLDLRDIQAGFSVEALEGTDPFGEML